MATLLAEEADQSGPVLKLRHVTVKVKSIDRLQFQTDVTFEQVAYIRGDAHGGSITHWLV